MITLGFIFTYLLSVTQLGEFLKLPKLINHFIEHSQEQSNLTFIEFLTIHYVDALVYDKDYEKDMELPFKSHSDFCNCSITTFCSPIPQFTFSKEQTIKEFKKPHFNYVFTFTSNFLSNIWQPPKTC
jgi:hypothetical protein